MRTVAQLFRNGTLPVQINNPLHKLHKTLVLYPLHHTRSPTQILHSMVRVPDERHNLVVKARVLLLYLLKIHENAVNQCLVVGTLLDLKHPWLAFHMRTFVRMCVGLIYEQVKVLFCENIHFYQCLLLIVLSNLTTLMLIVPIIFYIPQKRPLTLIIRFGLLNWTLILRINFIW